jgi:hypothetical protein
MRFAPKLAGVDVPRRLSLVALRGYLASMETKEAQSLPDLPGAELVQAGLGDLVRGVESAEALLVSIGAPRLRRLGLSVEAPLTDPEHRLYALLARDDPDAAHSRYNALVRRLVSFERAAECAQ